LAGCLGAQAGILPGEPAFEWDLELLSMDLNASNVLLPLGRDWSPILTDIHIGESANLDSLGKAFAFEGGPRGVIVTLAEPGDSMTVSSFFDVFFDISITDVDPAANFGGGPTDGLSLAFPDNGPAHMENFYTAIFDPAAPNFGLIPPPESAPYIGGFNIEIPLGADLNGNGEDDKIKFTLAANTLSDENRTFITLPDGTVIDNFESVLDLSGAVVDESQDPPFSIQLTGPTSASSRLAGLPVDVPDSGSSGACLAVGLATLLGWRVRSVASA
jgi:hypothetical protein